MGHDSTYTTSFEVLEGGNETIELLEKCDVTCREELRAREGHWIRELDCVNRFIAGRTKQENDHEYYERNKEKLKQYQRDYNEQNKEKVAEKKRQWAENNKERTAETKHAWYEQNKEAIAERRRKYREANKEAINERRREAYKVNKEVISTREKKWKQQHIRCEVCGATTTKGNYAQHKKAKYCLAAAAAKAEQDDSDM
jgi:hypothetical protein